jgi:hypothetical protein
LAYSIGTSSEVSKSVALVETIPSYTVFGQYIDKGMLTWEALNTTIVGVIANPSGYCAVYSYEKVINALCNTFADSEAGDISSAVKLYLDTEILSADFGPRSPFFLLGGSQESAKENGLGQKAVLDLPSGRRGINGYIDKTNGYTTRDRSVQSEPTPEAQGEAGAIRSPGEQS